MSQNGRKMAKMLHNAAKKFDWVCVKISSRNIGKCEGNIFKHVVVTYCILTFQIVTFINAKVTFFKHVTVKCCILTFQIVTFLNVKVIFQVYYGNTV